MNRPGQVFAVLAMVVISSCGGGDEATCSATVPCGGTIAAGRYRITSYCAFASEPVKTPACRAGTTVDVRGLKRSGTVSFNADGTYRSEGTIGGTITEVIPAGCLAEGILPTCAELDQTLKAEASSGSPMSGSCSGTGDCTCTIFVRAQPTMASGTYSTSGTTLTVTPDNGTPSAGGYCATPTQLSFEAPSIAVGTVSVYSARTSMVLTRE